MTEQTIDIAGRECTCYATAPEADTLLVQFADRHDMEAMGGQLEVIAKETSTPFRLTAVKVNDWQTELTPWTAPGIFSKVPFGDRAAETLRFATDELLPAMKCKCAILGGYSLAGLFALWAGYNTDAFSGIAAASPSVWYPQWTDYAAKHTTKAETVYISLGDTEHHTKNPVMARVTNCIRRQHELLMLQGTKTILEWNEGNHFNNVYLRMAKAFAWTLNNI